MYLDSDLNTRWNIADIAGGALKEPSAPDLADSWF